MDAFVNKVEAASSVPPLRVVSERSLQSVDLARLRSSHRRLTGQRDEMLRTLGRACMQALTDPSRDADSLDMLRTNVTALLALEQEMQALELRIQRAQASERHGSQPAPFLTVCPCGAPLTPSDTRCNVCHRDVAALVRLAAESKSQIVTVACTCGASLTAGIRFCPSCGRGIADLLERAGLPAPRDLPVCGGCGEAASPGDRYCSACGEGLAESPR